MSAHNFIDLTGHKFGKLTVIKQSDRNKHRMVLWDCLCDCGNHSIVEGSSLRSGHTKTCGCEGKAFIDLAGQRFGQLLLLKGRKTMARKLNGNVCVIVAKHRLFVPQL